MKYKREEEKIRIRGCILANERASIRMKEEQFSSELYRNFFSRKHRDGSGGNSTFENTVGVVAICIPARVYVYYIAG